MINAFQDVNPYSALKTFRRIISPKGFFRVNVFSREFRDEIFSNDTDFSDDVHFDKETGCSYLTLSPSANVKPLGYFTDKKGDRIPYYRILKSYNRRDLDKVFNECGFGILFANPIILPNEVWAKAILSWDISAQMQETLTKRERYPTIIDVIARPI